jgi:hypothetical protein
VVTWFDAGNACANLFNYTAAFVSENRWESALRIFT